MEKFEFADLHCHPNLKAFGNSFSKNGTLNPKASMWYQKRPTFGTNLIRKLTGLTKFSQSDLLTMIQGNVKIAFVSFYPFEKGFFTNQYLPDYWSAYLANLITSISYNRVRYLQQHSDYFYDLMKEYEFVLNSQREFIKDSDRYSWGFANDNRSINNSIRRKNHISIIPNQMTHLLLYF